MNRSSPTQPNPAQLSPTGTAEDLIVEEEEEG